MKIGILTYFGDLNIGTNLQAYATLEQVKKISPNSEIEFINISSFKHKNRPFIKNITLKSLLNDISRINKYKTFIKSKFPLSNPKQLILNSYEEGVKNINSNKYDVVIVGADTLLELHRMKPDTISFYWLSKKINAKKFMIASSARDTTYDALSNKQRELLKETINNFNLIGVRDDATYRLINSLETKLTDSIEKVPDPTFTLDVDYTHIEKYLTHKKITIPQKTVCLNFSLDDKWIKDVVYELKKENYTIASFRPAPFVDILLNDLGPLEQLGIYRYFSVVITNRFHDTIFCLKNNTPFLTFPFDTSYITADNESKYQSLINTFGLLDTNFFIPDSQFNPSKINNLVDVAIESFLGNKELKNNLTILSNEYKHFLYKCIGDKDL